MDFAWVPGGCFFMGCGAFSVDCELYEHPAHRVCVRGFWMARHEVTQAQWRQVMGENPSINQSGGPAGDSLPVEGVTWEQAAAFARRLSELSGARLSLPTEAQWEYAARSGGRDEPFAGGHDAGRLGWYFENSLLRAHPVGMKAPNGLGLFDMSGNVAEWCLDVFDRDFYAKSPEEEPLCSAPGNTPGFWRVRRGGNFAYLSREARSTARGKLEPGARDERTGLRLVRLAD
jgi:formylglycine-generating enzyme required for sulfatase activity